VAPRRKHLGKRHGGDPIITERPTDQVSQKDVPGIQEALMIVTQEPDPKDYLCQSLLVEKVMPVKFEKKLQVKFYRLKKDRSCRERCSKFLEPRCF